MCVTDELSPNGHGEDAGPAGVVVAGAPEAAMDPPAGAGDLLRAVMALTVARLKDRAPVAAGPGDGGGRAAYLG